MGGAANGIWTLEMDDKAANASVGTFNCASLFIQQAECATGGGLCELCPDSTLTAALGSGSLQMTNRLNTNGIASSCGSPKSCPGMLADGGMRNYAAHVYRNGPSLACLTASLVSDDGLQLSLYTNSFNPADLCSNYVADPGAATSLTIQTQMCSFNAAADQVIIAVVSGLSPGDEGDYTLAMSGGDCRPALRITPSGLDGVLDWTTAAIGYQLETTNAVEANSPIWQTAPGTPVIVNSRYQVTNSILGTKQFFRLRKP
jgi:hypothetical protein